MRSAFEPLLPLEIRDAKELVGSRPKMARLPSSRDRSSEVEPDVRALIEQRTDSLYARLLHAARTHAQRYG
jgi:hypothetical protein